MLLSNLFHFISFLPISIQLLLLKISNITSLVSSGYRGKSCAVSFNTFFETVYIPKAITSSLSTFKFMIGLLSLFHQSLVDKVSRLEKGDFMNLSFENRIVREKVVAIFILVGSVNLPIVKFSVDWWNTLHQPATISKLSKPSIDPSMMTPLIIMTFAFIMIGIAIAILRIKTEIISRKSYLS